MPLIFLIITTLQPSLSRLHVTVTDPSGAVIVGARARAVAADGTAWVQASGAGGEVTFELPTGRYSVRVESDGFETYEAVNVRVRAGDNRHAAKMSLSRHAETVHVERDPRAGGSDPRGDTFATVLQPHHIAQLPDDPDELERALKDLAGPGATVRVNGFRSTRVPPKDQIQQIRFRRNAFSADTHEAGGVFVDIITRPGGAQWRGSTAAGYRTSALDARNALAAEDHDESLRRYSLSLSGPLWKQHTSLSLNVDSTSAVDARPIVATPPDGAFGGIGARSLRLTTVTGRLEHALTTAHMLRVEMDRAQGRTGGAGVGDFNLPERAYRHDTGSHGTRVSLAGALGTAVYHELRVQARADAVTFTPETTAPAVIVLNTFNAGGAQIEGRRRTRGLEIADDVDWSVGPHAVRAGFLLESFRLDSEVARNAGGTFTFASLDAYRRGIATTFSRNVGNPRIAFTNHQAAFYVLDDMRARPNLTLSGGVRFEYQSLIGAWQAGPRAGLAWSPFSSGATSVRAGAGVFFDWFDASSYESAAQLDGSRQQIETVVQPLWPLTSGERGQVLPPGRVRFASRLEQPRIVQSAIAVEQALPGEIRLSASWTRSRGDRQLRGLNVNGPSEGGRADPRSGPIVEVGSSARSAADSLVMQATYSPAEAPGLQRSPTGSRDRIMKRTTRQALRPTPVVLISNGVRRWTTCGIA